jgi:hypothetical protein
MTKIFDYFPRLIYAFTGMAQHSVHCTVHSFFQMSTLKYLLQNVLAKKKVTEKLHGPLFSNCTEICKTHSIVLFAE